MDMATMMPYVVQAVGGIVGGNILGALTRGGGGLIGRTLIGAIGGVAAGYGLPQFAPSLQGTLDTLIAGDNGVMLGNLLTGAGGGGLLGLVGGLLLRPRG